MYYTSKILHKSEVRYPKIQKLFYSIIVAAKRLRPYFHAHSIVVLTDQPLKAVLRSPDTSERIAKWTIKLKEFDITFKPRSAMKAQVLADFIVECTQETSTRTTEPPEESSSIAKVESARKVNFDETFPIWTLQVDGASNSNGCGAGLILIDLKGQHLDYALRFLFSASNNQAEYEALLAGLKLAIELDVR